MKCCFCCCCYCCCSCQSQKLTFKVWSVIDEILLLFMMVLLVLLTLQTFKVWPLLLLLVPETNLLICHNQASKSWDNTKIKLWWWVCRGIFMSNPTYIGLGQARLWLRWGCENTVMMAVSVFTFSVHFHNFVEQKIWFQSFMPLILLQIQQTKNYVLYPIWKTTTQHAVNQEVKYLGGLWIISR